MLLITSYSGYQSATNFIKKVKIIIGDVLVETEFPFKGTIKLVTYLMVFSLIAWFTAIKIFENSIRNLKVRIKTFLQIISIIAATITIYELIYNFIVWNSLITTNLFNNIFDPNSEEINYPVRETPWNLYFATQMLLASVIITFHSYYVMTKSKK
jgi:glucan phosphoethanolaminetransferase (alkaline phosphatase superfamily)